MDIKKISTPSQFIDLKSKGATEKHEESASIAKSLTDSIEISNQSQSDLGYLNISRVNELKEKIESGSYEFNLDGIAKAIAELNEK